MKTLKSEYLKYLNNCSENLDQILIDYAKEITGFLKIYEENIATIIYVDRENLLVRFNFYLTKTNSKTVLKDGVLKELKEEIIFLKNNIIIQKKLTPKDVSIVSAIHDVSKLKEDIQQAELARI
jgi:hypothetical protein